MVKAVAAVVAVGILFWIVPMFVLKDFVRAIV